MLKKDLHPGQVSAVLLVGKDTLKEEIVYLPKRSCSFQKYTELPLKCPWFGGFAYTSSFSSYYGFSPTQVKNSVASPGGTTICGLAKMESAGVRGAIMSAVKAASDRAAELKP